MMTGIKILWNLPLTVIDPVRDADMKPQRSTPFFPMKYGV